MPDSVNGTIADFLLRYRDASDAGDALPLALLNRVDADLCSKMPLRHKTFTVSVTINVQEYAIKDFESGAGANIVRIFGVDYVRSATQDDYKPLRAGDTRYFDIKYPGWRNAGNDEPTDYYVDAGATAARVLGLRKKPHKTSTGSPAYPNLKVYTSIKKVLVAGDNLPDDLLTNEVYIAGMCWHYAKVNDRENAGSWLDVYEHEKKELAAYLTGYVQPFNTKFVPGHMPRLSVT